MMALRKEPERRYATVDALCEDLRDFLDGFPVQCRAGYGLRIDSANSQNAIAGQWLWAAVALLGMIIAGIIIWREKQQAEMRFQQVRQLAHSVVFELERRYRGSAGFEPGP